MAYNSGGQEFKIQLQEIWCLVRVQDLLRRWYLWLHPHAVIGRNKLHWPHNSIHEGSCGNYIPTILWLPDCFP